MVGAPALFGHQARGSAETIEAFERDGVVVLGSAVPVHRIQSATRLLNLEIARHGIDPHQLPQWQQSTFFPHLRWNKEVWDLLPGLAVRLIRRSQDDEWAEAQLLLKFPDEAESWPLEPHVDEVPAWAPTSRYRGIIGVPLTSAGSQDGCLHVWPGSHRGMETSPVPVVVEPGDVVVMHPQLGHSGGLNRGPSIRMAVYFRLLASGAAWTMDPDTDGHPRC